MEQFFLKSTKTWEPHDYNASDFLWDLLLWMWQKEKIGLKLSLNVLQKPERWRQISEAESTHSRRSKCVCTCLTACVLFTEAMQIRQVSAPDWNRSLTYWPVLCRPVASPPTHTHTRTHREWAGIPQHLRSFISGSPYCLQTSAHPVKTLVKQSI